jgi:hypothetical protein
MVKNETAPGPDFLCIGMGKSGTKWLYDQCEHHPAFWMPPIRELHYLDREFPRRVAKNLLNVSREVANQRRIAWGKRSLEDRDMTFLHESRDARHQPMDLEHYARMFRFKGQQLSGDVTPSYSALPVELITRVVTRFPEVKVILLIRDPVARAWSHICMKHRGGSIDAGELREVDRFRAVLKKSKVLRTDSPATIASKWSSQVPRGQFRHFFFDDLVADPAKLRRDLMSFLGADPEIVLPVDPAHNKEIAKLKLQITDEIRMILVEHFAEELVASAEFFGGHAREWPRRNGVTLMA